MIDSRRMRLKVDLLPRGPYADVVILVDVLRSTTAAPILFERGAERVFMTRSVRSARSFAESQGCLLAGERDLIVPEGFNHSTSPKELLQLDLSGRSVVLLAHNTSGALSSVPQARVVLLGSFYNAGAVVKAARASAETEIAIVCAGLDGSESLEDVVCAGFLARSLQRALGSNVELLDGTRLAMALVRAFPDPQEAVYRSAAGDELRRAGLTEDIAVSTLISQTEVAPLLKEITPWQPGRVYGFGRFGTAP